jgi:hypothetical protein
MYVYICRCACMHVKISYKLLQLEIFVRVQV